MAGKKSWIRDIFLPPKKSNEFNAMRYIEDLNAGAFRDKFNIGVSEQDSGKWLLKDGTKEPNLLYVGSMGSGKSVAANFTILTWMLANSDQTLLFLMDPMKGANDYQALFGLPQVYDILSSEQGIIRVIDLVYDEAMARRDLFNEHQAESLIEYEKKTGKKMARVVMLMEEFHAIPYVIMNFDKEFKTELTTAHKFHQLMRIGRSYGIWVVACSQKATKSDIPSEIVPNFTQKQIFRVSKAEATYFMSDATAANIRTDQKGRCVTDYGFVQFPMIYGDDQKKLIKKYVKPLTAGFAYLTPEVILDYTQGRSTEDLYRLKKVTDLVQGIDSYDPELVISILHKKQAHKVEKKNSLSDHHGISHIIHWNNDIKVAVLTKAGKAGKKITGKHISRLKKAMDLHECTHGIIYTSMVDLPNAIYKAANELGIEVVDHEDMLRLAYRVESEGEEANLSPDKLADEDKESGSYQRIHQIKDDQEEFDISGDYQSFDQLVDTPASTPAPSRKKTQEEREFNELMGVDDDNDMSEAQKLDRLLNIDDHTDMTDFEDDVEDDSNFSDQEKEEVKPVVAKPKIKDPVAVAPVVVEPPKKALDEAAKNISLVSAKNAISRTLKRIQVKKLCTINKNETPSLLFHALRNEEGDVYRVLFYILDNNNKKHEYYLDRQVPTNSKFSFKQKTSLGIASVEEWNNQKEVLPQEKFDREFLEFLENFNSCAFPVHSVCWGTDAEFLTQYLKMCPYMVDHPTVIEDWLGAQFGLRRSREEMIEEFGLKVTSPDLFTPINLDFRVWKQTN